MADWEEHTVSCNPQEDKKMRVDIDITREADPFMMPFFSRIWNSRDALYRPSKFAYYGTASSIHMVPGEAEHQYLGFHINYWKNIDALDESVPNPVSRTDLWLTVREPPAQSELRVVFLFDSVTEFDINMVFQWKGWRTARGMNVVDLPHFKPTVQHEIRRCRIWFTDNMETAYPDGMQHRGRELIVPGP